MDSRSPLAFLHQNNRLNTFPRLINPTKPSPSRSSPTPSSSNTRGSPHPLSSSIKLTLSTKRKSSFADDNNNNDDAEEEEDSIMSTSPQPSHRILKRPRQTSNKRSLPISRILDNLEKRDLVTLLSTLLSRHPELSAEVQTLAPKLTPQSALTAINKLEESFHASFPYGGDKSGEYAYSRIHNSYNTLLSAVADYTTHFLPPHSTTTTTTSPTSPPPTTAIVSPPELLSFLDSITNLLERIPLFSNPIHNIARETAFVEITGAWEIGVRYFLETNGSFAFMLGGWMERLEAHAQKVEGLGRVVEQIRQQVSWTRNG